MTMLGAFVGALGGGLAVMLSGDNITHTVTDPADAEASVTLESDGDYVTAPGGDVGDWIRPKAAAGAAYEVRATETSGTVSTGTVGSWLALSSNRAWSVARNIPGTKTCTLLLEIRRASDGVVQDSAYYTLTATVEA